MGKKTGWNYKAGERGRNRVRAYVDRKSGNIFLEFYEYAPGEAPKRKSIATGHQDRERAKRQADGLAAELGKGHREPTEVTNLRTLFDSYERLKTPGKSRSARCHDRRTLPLFVKAFGAHRRAETLNQRDWDGYVQRRRRGELAAPGREGMTVRQRVLEQDLRLLLAVLNWAERSQLITKNPLRGFAIPREESPRRAVLTPEQFAEVRRAATSIGTSAELFVVLAWYTGHRAASIRQVRWSDVDLERERVHWRGETDKVGYDHWNPLHPECVVVLRRAKVLAEVTSSDSGYIFQSERDASLPMPRPTCCKLWKTLAQAVGIPKGEGYGWHSFRRAFANRLRNVSLRDLKDLGGWKTEKTVVAVYQGPSEDAQREALKVLG
jgi:integrase